MADTGTGFERLPDGSVVDLDPVAATSSLWRLDLD